MNRDEYWFWMCRLYHMEPAAAKILLTCFNDPEEAYYASESTILEKTGLTMNAVRTIISQKDEYRIRTDLEKVKNNGISFISREDPAFPGDLFGIQDCPVCLFVRGTLPDQTKPSAGMVGARACSGYGKEYAEKYAFDLASAGVQIISGMAIGIDTVCARSALNAGGKTFAILGSGIDVIYPRENIELYYNIISGGGGIISEYPPGTPPRPWNFPHRNRLIAAFSQLLIVIEAGKRSGTLSTAMHALNQGKDVWALPGRVGDRLSEGCNELISDGAGILTDIGKILRELKTDPEIKNISNTCISDRSGIYRFLSHTPISVDEIIKRSGSAVSDIVAELAELELEGLAIKLPGDCYCRK